jgi:hypothetical protein
MGGPPRPPIEEPVRAPARLAAIVQAGGGETRVRALHRLRAVIHDWADADAQRVLTTCREVMPVDARLLLVEAILPEHAQDGPEAVRMGIHMLVLFSARERTQAQCRRLLADAGFELQRAVPTASPAGLSVLEATVAAPGR